jgi:DNA gyrase subunit B
LKTGGFDADKIAEQVLINKRSRETAEKARLNMKKKLTGSIDIANRVQKFVDCRSRDPWRAGDIHRGGRLRSGRLSS